jgi:hypothetical protein
VDPLDALGFTPATEPEILGMSASSLGVDEEDWGVFEQLRTDPKLVSIRDEIALNRVLRIKVAREMATDQYQRTLEGHYKLRDLLGGKGGKKLDDILEEHFPSSPVSLKYVEALRKLMEASGKLVEQQKKITEGFTYKVDWSPADIQQIYTHVIRPVVPVEYLPALLERAAQYAPQMVNSQLQLG